MGWVVGGQAQFIAINEEVRGANTSSYVTTNDIRSGSPASGLLRNLSNGATTGVNLTLTNYAAGAPTLAVSGVSGVPRDASPASNVFGAAVTFGNGYILLLTNQVLAHVLTGLDSNSLYSLQGTTIKGTATSAFQDRWTVFELAGASSFSNAHSPGCVTNGLGGIVMAANQVAICTGDNREGRSFDWEEVRPAGNTLVIYSKRFYTVQNIPGVITNSFVTPGYGLEVLRVEEFASGGCSPARLSVPPRDVTGWLRDPVALVAVGAGTAPLFYQWYLSPSPGGASNLIAGATNATYALASASLSDIGLYTVVVQNDCGTHASAPASLTLRTNPPVILTPARDATVVLSNAVQFSVTVSGSAPLSAQWFKDGVAIPGATALSYAIVSVSYADAGLYRLVVTNQLGAVTNQARLTVTAEPVRIVQEPADLVLWAGDSNALVSVAAGSPPFWYQWYKGLNPSNLIAQATNAVYVISPATGADAGFYTVVVSNPGGSAGSRTASVKVLTDPPVIATPPTNATVFYGSPAGFTVGVSGSVPVFLQWFKDEVPIAGATNSSYAIPQTREGDAGRYAVVATNRLGMASASATLSLLDTALVITVPPLDQAVLPGSNATFMVEVSGPHPRFQWFHGELALGGATSETLTLTGVTTSQVGDYRVMVSNGAGSVTSAVAQLTLVALALPDALNPSPNGTVWCLAVQNDGKILLGGDFSSVSDQPRSYLARLNADGSLDSTFHPGTNQPSVVSLVVQQDGRILVGGSFTTLEGQPRNRVGRLQTDGTLDAAFNPNADGPVWTMVELADGKILVGGDFTTLGGQTCNRIGRLNPDGRVDSTFGAGANGAVHALAVQPDGKIVVGGEFTALGGQARQRLGRLNTDGSVEAGFDPGADTTVLCLTLQTDGKILAGGAFTRLGGQSHSGLGRLHPDGAADGSFTSGANGWIYSMQVQCDGCVLVGGDFDRLAGQERYRLARLMPDGSVDANFAALMNDTVYALGLQKDGAILVGGRFGSVGGQERSRVARLNNTAPATESLTVHPDGSGVTWLRGGTGPEAWRITFEVATNHETGWISLGAGQRVPGGWGVAGLALPPTANVRARGFVTGGAGNGSGWFGEAHVGVPLITAQPESLWTNAGATVLLAVAAEGSLPLFWQWQKDGMSLGGESARVAGARSNVLTISGVQGSDRGVYSVLVSNAFGWVVSQSATLGVVDPVIASPPASRTAWLGSNASFAIVAAGTAPLSYEWYRGGVLLPESSAPTLVVSNVQWGDDGSEFRVVVGNSEGRATSAVARLSVAMPAQLDPFLPKPGNAVWSLAVQPDGKVLFGGDFSSFGPDALGYLGRLNPDGTLDTSFTNWADHARVTVLTVQPDGGVLVGGGFSKLGGQTRHGLARIKSDGVLDAAFDPNADGTVRALLVLPDGGMVVGGDFSTLGGQPHARLGRLGPDGRVDATFTVEADGPVHTLALQSDGKLLVGGEFSSVAGQTRQRLARLHSDGHLDNSFNPGASSVVRCLAVQGDGRIWVGGDFWQVGGQERTCLARLRPDGSLDESFGSQANGAVYSIVGQADGKVLVGGNFTALGGQSRMHLGRFNPDGTLDPTFTPTTDAPLGGVFALTIQADGAILVGGGFTVIEGQYRPFMARLRNTQPARDSLTLEGSTLHWDRGGTGPEFWRTTFEVSTNGGAAWTDVGAGTQVPGGWQLEGVAPPAHAAVRVRGYVAGGPGNACGWFVEAGWGAPSLAIEPLGQRVTAGQTVQFNVVAHGDLPLSFQWCRDGVPLPGATKAVLNVTNVQAEMRGDYTVVVSNAPGSVASAAARLAVVLPLAADGFDPQPDSIVRALAVQTDGRVVVGGDFSNLGGRFMPYLGRLNRDGSLDGRFRPGANGRVKCVAIQSDGSILVGGEFLSLGGNPRARIGRLNRDGSLDLRFDPSANGPVRALLVEPDGRILLGGEFTLLGGQTRNRIARVNADGSLDGSFNPDANDLVSCIARQPDGRIVIGGSFTNVGAQTRHRLARLNADGSVDGSFSPGADGPVAVLVIQTDGKILVGGSFTVLGGQSRANIARLNPDGTLDLSFAPPAAPQLIGGVSSLALQADGRILVGINNALGSLGLVRLNADGSRDSLFDAADVWLVHALALQADGAVLLGGALSNPGGQPNSLLRRLTATEPAGQRFIQSGSTLSWARTGTSPEVWCALFEASLDGGLTWADLGPAERVADGWVLAGVNVPAQTSLRARGGVSSGAGNGSVWWVESLSGAPVMTRQPTGAAAFVGEDATFGVAVDGTPPYSYQWYRNDLPVEGATHPTWVLTNVSWASENDAYRVRVSNGFGGTTSAVVRLTVGLPPALDALDGRLNDPSEWVNVVVPQPDGKILVAGYFQSLAGQPRSLFGRLRADGSLDETFTAQADSEVTGLLLHSDGRILVAGGFHTLAGEPRRFVGRLNSDGSLDAAFNLALDRRAFCLAEQADGKILVGGQFQTLAGQPCRYLARFESDGTLDTTFHPQLNTIVNSLLLQPDGKILVQGYSWSGAPAPLTRLNPDGSLDADFVCPSTDVFALAADGQVVLTTPAVATFGTPPYHYVARHQPNGRLDRVFADTQTIHFIKALAIQADGRILVGGHFLPADGTAQLDFGKFEADGALDPLFNPGGVWSSNQNALTFALQPDGKVLVGGSFSTLLGQSRQCLGRLSNTRPATQTLSVEGSEITWLRGGSSPEVWRTRFAFSTNGGIEWADLGGGGRGSGGWRLTGVTLPENASLRARGFIAQTACTTGMGGGSQGWFVETIVGPPCLTTVPRDLTTNAGAVAEFSVAAGGTAPLGFQWYHEDIPLAGASGDTLRFDAVRPDQAGRYRVVVSNVFGAVTSAPVLLSLGPTALRFVASPAPQLTNGQFFLRLTNLPASGQVLIEASSHLRGDWTPVSTNPLPAAALDYAGAVDTNQPRRFYRALWHQP